VFTLIAINLQIVHLVRLVHSDNGFTPFCEPTRRGGRASMLDLFGGRGGARVMCVQGMSLDVIYPEWVANPLANNS